MIYEYTDTFIVNSLEDEEIEKAEANALLDLDKQGITDPYYREKMCYCLVYIELAGTQLEAEGMTERVAYYRKEYQRFDQLATNGTDNSVFSGEIGRA